MKLFNVEEAASYARLSAKTLRRAIGAPNRPLRCYRIGRRIVISEDDLLTWLERHRFTVTGSMEALPVSPAAKGLLTRLMDAPRQPPKKTSDARRSNFGRDVQDDIR